MFGLRGLPRIHPLHDNLVLFTFHHVIGEHGMEVWNGSSQDNPVSTEFVFTNLQIILYFSRCFYQK